MKTIGELDNRFMLLIAAPFILIVISILGIRFISFNPLLDPSEQRIEKFVHETTLLTEQQPFDISGLKAPFEIKKQIIPGSSSMPEISEERLMELKVSMIVVSEGRRMAIINGMVIREGDNIDVMKVARIEKGKVLLTYRTSEDNSRKTKWIYMEGVK